MLSALNKTGVLGAAAATAASLGCCAPAALGPLAGLLAAGGVLDRVPVVWQLPILYGSLGVALVGLGLGWRRHRRLSPALLFLPGAAAILYPLHEALDVSVLTALIWLGLGLLLASAGLDTWLSLRARRCRVSRNSS